MSAADRRLPLACLVTGGAQRIGRAITLALVEAGYAVAIHSRRPGGAARLLADDIVARGGHAAVVAGDLADRDVVAGLVPAARTAIGPLTLLVNNACEFEPDVIGSLDPDQYERQFAVNLRAPLFLAEVFAAQVPQDADASVVNLLDQRVFRPTPQFFSYTLTKSALFTATTTMAQQFAPRIRVNAVAPGPTLPSPRQDAAAFARQQAAVPLKRGPTPDDVAQAVVFLAGAVSVTGATIPVDGGQRLAWRTEDTAIEE